jgi:hypothetical protein
MPLIGAPLVYADTAGFEHGVSDAQTKHTRDWYIPQPGNGVAFHSKQFVEDYIRGFCSISSQESTDAEQVSWDCSQGPTSGSWVSQN